MTINQAPLQVFFSYAHKDRKRLVQLKEYLSPMQREGLICLWDDSDIAAGRQWNPDIEWRLNSAHLILMLISASFISSDYIYSHELPRAMDRHEKGDASVIPVIVRPVDWQSQRFKQLQVLPRDVKPITKWPSPDDGWEDVARGVRRAVGEFQSRVILETAPAASEMSFVGETREAYDRLVAHAREYNRIRGAMLSGRQRTSRMNEVLDKARHEALDEASCMALIDHLFRNGGDGERLVAITLLQARPDARHLDIVESGIGQSRSAFEQYYALIAAEKLVPVLDDASRQRLVAIIRNQRSDGEDAHIRVHTERWALSERILASLNTSGP